VRRIRDVSVAVRNPNQAIIKSLKYASDRPHRRSRINQSLVSARWRQRAPPFHSDCFGPRQFSQLCMAHGCVQHADILCSTMLFNRPQSTTTKSTNAEDLDTVQILCCAAQHRKCPFPRGGIRVRGTGPTRLHIPNG